MVRAGTAMMAATFANGWNRQAAAFATADASAEADVDDVGADIAASSAEELADTSAPMFWSSELAS